MINLENKLNTKTEKDEGADIENYTRKLEDFRNAIVVYSNKDRALNRIYLEKTEALKKRIKEKYPNGEYDSYGSFHSLIGSSYHKDYCTKREFEEGELNVYNFLVDLNNLIRTYKK